MSTELLTTPDETHDFERSALGIARQLVSILDAIPSLVLIVNDKREVVHANRQAEMTLSGDDIGALLGKRPGDVLHCEHTVNCPSGCGTGEACAMCGAANALREAENGVANVQECRIRQHESGVSMDYRVSATPVEIDSQKLNLLTLIDISHENRRRALERIFFHDLLNTLGALSGYVQLMQDSTESDREIFRVTALRLADVMAEEINEQRDLAAAENNDLVIRIEQVNARELLEQVVLQYRTHPQGRGRKISIGSAAADVTLHSDKRLLLRIMSNMLKNALEATPPGGEVTLRCHTEQDTVRFAVHNATAIPREVQLQMFHRAFSTKGGGRGLGTYSMKLLGERYLSGKISFTSSSEEGTVFIAEFPQSSSWRGGRYFAGK